MVKFNKDAILFITTLKNDLDVSFLRDIQHLLGQSRKIVSQDTILACERYPTLQYLPDKKLIFIKDYRTNLESYRKLLTKSDLIERFIRLNYGLLSP
jgi:hypothetical protein